MKTKHYFFMLLAVANGLLMSSCSKDESDTALAGITLSSTSLSMLPETADTLRCTFYPDNATDKEVVWTSTDETVATVSAQGIVRALKVGTAQITATSAADKTIKATCNVSVANRQLTNVSGDVSGKWEKNSTVYVTGQINVPAGKTLTIEEGVQVIFSSNGVGANHTPIEFMVNGNLYCNGTATNRIRFSVAENERTAENTFKGLWGGIVATKTCQEMLIDNTIIEYTGGAVMADSPSALAGLYTAGNDADAQITTINPSGRYVVTNSVLCKGNSDGIYMMGGNGIISHNLIYANGSTGCEAINVKSGCKVDASFNLIYSPNTNGLKLSSAAQDDASGKTQAQVRAYNNTIVNAGWRRDGVKGGSVYVEKNALVSVFNNLMVNCKFKAQTPKWGTPSITDGCATESVIDYNYYASGAQQSTLTQDVTNGTLTAYLGYTLKNKNVYPAAVDTHSRVSASAGDAATDPGFVNFPYNTNPLVSYTYDDSWDFHVKAGSPVLTGAYGGSESNMQPLFGVTGVTVNGKTYKSEGFKSYFGAFGTK
jgi:hypothetical protein